MTARCWGGNRACLQADTDVSIMLSCVDGEVVAELYSSR
jgi:hypothetical protein